MEKFYLQISQHELYKEGDPLVEQILHEMAFDTILHVCKFIWYPLVIDATSRIV